MNNLTQVLMLTQIGGLRLFYRSMPACLIHYKPKLASNGRLIRSMQIIKISPTTSSCLVHL